MKIENDKFDSEGNLKNGIFPEFFKNGTVACEGLYTDGMRTGEWKYYYLSGGVKAAGEFSLNRMVGEWKWFHENGAIWQIGYFDNFEKKTGVWTNYDKEGNFISETEFIEGKKVKAKVSEKAASTVDQYISEYSGEMKKKLEQLRSAIKATAPDAREVISWGMPTYKYNGDLVHFAAYKNHIGFYPTPSAIVAFKDKLEKFQCTKGAVQFPTSLPLPLDLIKEIVLFRVSENLSKHEKKKC